MNDYICMNYGNEEYVILDLPREETLTREHTRVLEDLKDGNLSTAKYQGSKRFIRGVKCIVFTNNWIDPKIYKTLTEDRWDVHVIDHDKVYKVTKSGGNLQGNTDSPPLGGGKGLQGDKAPPNVLNYP